MDIRYDFYTGPPSGRQKTFEQAAQETIDSMEKHLAESTRLLKESEDLLEQAKVAFKSIGGW